MGLDHARQALLAAIAAAAAFVALSGDDGAASLTTSAPIVGEGDIITALTREEVLLRRVVSERVLAGQAAPTGADPVFLATGPAHEAFVVTRFGAVFAIDGDAVRPVDGLDGASPSPRLHAWLAQADDGGDDDDEADSAVVVLPGPDGADIVSLRRLARQVVVSRGAGARLTVPFTGGLTSIAARREGGLLVVFVVGVEDAPLDRSLGTFGRLDPFLYRLAIDGRGDVVARAALNLGEHGVVTPKAIALHQDGRVMVAGAGSGTLGIVGPDLAALDVHDGLVGANDVVVLGDRVLLASPVADAVAVVDLVSGVRRVLPVVDAARPPAPPLSRLGEALVFSTALAPEQTSDGPASRFTCEACHDDGGVDGRRHSSGRFGDDGEVLVTTKPLRGLFQNAPLFSRAFDDSVAAMVHAEVRVANAGSPRAAWTPLVPAVEARFLKDVVGDAFGDVIDPVTQRRAMLHFFADLMPPPVRSTTMTPTSLDWQRFGARCAGCHAPRVFADDAASAVDDLERAGQLARLRGLVWASERRVDVGVRPLVREGGARVSSLRGIADKRPLLSNGSAATLEHLMRRLRVDDAGFVWHDGPRERGAPLPDEEQAAILRVLRSL